MRGRWLLAVLLLLPSLTGCLVPENMTTLREELGYASVELPDVVVRIRADSLELRLAERVTFTAVVEGIDDLGNATPTWDLGDGTTTEGTTVDYAYLDAGTFNVTVTVQPPVGPAATDQVQVSVQDNEPPHPVIQVETPGELVEGEPVVLSAVDSFDPDEDPLEHTWSVDGVEAGTGPRIELDLAAGSHQVELASSDGLATVRGFRAVGVALPLAHEAELTVQDPATEHTFAVAEHAKELTVALTHSTQMGVDDVRLELLTADGEVVASSDRDAEPGASSGSEGLSVSGTDLPPGTYQLRAQLTEGLSSRVTIEGTLTYMPLSPAS